MPDYYRGPTVRVTHKVFQTRSPVPATYLISELRGVHIVVGERETRPSATRLILAGSIAAAAVVAIGDHDPVSATGLIFTAATLTVLGCVRARVAVYELRGWYQGRDVCLFRTSDARVLGQVSRAYVRANERLSTSD